MPGLGFAPLDINGEHAPLDINREHVNAATISENDVSTIVTRLAISRNYDNFCGELAKLDPQQAQKWQDIQGLLNELDKCNEIHHSILNGVSEIVMKYRINEEKNDKEVLEDITNCIGFPQDTMLKMFNALTRETNRLMNEKLTCERRLIEFENGITSIKSCMEATRAQLSSTFCDESFDTTNIKKYIEASTEMTTSMANIAKKRIYTEAKCLFDINHRLMMIQKWTKANHIRAGETCACSICYETSVNAFFKDCGHTGCYDCLQKLNTCPWCRGPACLKKMFFNGPDTSAQVPAPVFAHVLAPMQHDDFPNNMEEILWEPQAVLQPIATPTTWDHVIGFIELIRNCIHGTTVAL